MKIAEVHVECCRERPFSDSLPNPQIKLCQQLDGKRVTSNEIDADCPLADAAQ